jgi:death-on-curing protein
VIVYLSGSQILGLHEALVKHFGGAAAVRDRGFLESAAARPAMTFGGEDLYPDIPSKAAALMHSLVLNHPFLDGNKRVGVASAEFFIEQNDYGLGATDGELEELTLAVAEGEVEVEALTIWLRQRLRPVE